MELFSDLRSQNLPHGMNECLTVTQQKHPNLNEDTDSLKTSENVKIDIYPRTLYRDTNISIQVKPSFTIYKLKLNLTNILAKFCHHANQKKS